MRSPIIAGFKKEIAIRCPKFAKCITFVVQHFVAVFGQNSSCFLVEDNLDTINYCIDCTIVKEQVRLVIE